MVRFGSILILVLSAITLCAQDEPQSVLRSGLLRAQGTIAFGTFTELNSNPIYLHGNLEYYIKPGLSVRGDSYFHLPPSENSVFKMNHQLYIGPSFHLNTGGNFSPYAGIQGDLHCRNMIRKYWMFKLLKMILPLILWYPQL